MSRHVRVVLSSLLTISAVCLTTTAEARQASGYRAARNSRLQTRVEQRAVGHKAQRARPRQQIPSHLIAKTPMPYKMWQAIGKAVRERNPRQRVRILKRVNLRSDVIANILTWGSGELQTLDYYQRKIAQDGVKRMQRHNSRYTSDHKYRYRCEQFKKMGGTAAQFAALPGFAQMNLGAGVTVSASTNVNTGATKIERSRAQGLVQFGNWLQNGMTGGPVRLTD